MASKYRQSIIMDVQHANLNEEKNDINEHGHKEKKFAKIYVQYHVS